MPTERFFNLPPEKQQRINAAAWQEMSRVPYPEVSINKIIKAADIPRGSFYQYFEDKDDLLDHMLEDYHRGILQTLEDSLHRNEGDMFRAVSDLFNYTISYGLRPENTEFCRNVFVNHKLHNASVEEIKTQLDKEKTLLRHWRRVSAKSFRFASDEDLQDILEILIILFRNSVIQVFENISRREELEKSFTNKIAILKHGIVKLAEEANV